MDINKVIHEIGKYEEKLGEENKKIFDQIILKIRYSKLADKDAEEFLYHCVDLLMQAEKDGTSAYEVLGTKDIPAFCNEYIEETFSKYSTWKRLYLQFETLIMVFFIYTCIFEVGLKVLTEFFKKGKILIDFPITVSMIVHTMVVLVLVHLFVHNLERLYNGISDNPTKKERIKEYLMIILIYLIIIAFFVASIFFLKYTICTVNLVILLGVGCILYAITWYVHRMVI